MPWLNHSVEFTCVCAVVLSGGVIYLMTKLQGLISGTTYNYILARPPSNLQHASLFRKGRQMNVPNKKKRMTCCYLSSWRSGPRDTTDIPRAATLYLIPDPPRIPSYTPL